MSQVRVLGIAPRAPTAIIVIDILYSLYICCICDIKGIYFSFLSLYALGRFVSSDTVTSMIWHCLLVESYMTISGLLWSTFDTVYISLSHHISSSFTFVTLSGL